MRAKNIIEVINFTQEELKYLIQEALAFKKDKHRQSEILKNKRVGLIFDSNSLRTKISFESAAYLLGGSSYFIEVRDITHEKDGTKREDYVDIIDTLDRMVDCYVVRDYSRQILKVLKRKDFPPFINGFCNTGHPSQALADLSVIQWKKGAIAPLECVGVCPTKGSGVMESFVFAILMLGGKITLITPNGTLKGKNKDFHKTVADLTSRYHGTFKTTKVIDTTVAKADVLYVDEWWENKKNFLNKKMGVYKVDEKFLKNKKNDLLIMHCLPAHPGREISRSVMNSQNSIIFDQAEFRVYSAMSLLAYMAEDQ